VACCVTLVGLLEVIIEAQNHIYIYIGAEPRILVWDIKKNERKKKLIFEGLSLTTRLLPSNSSLCAGNDIVLLKNCMTCSVQRTVY
jgi:hypothetical protein